MCDRNMCPKLKLSFALSRATSGFSAPNSISELGDKIFVVYDINITKSNNVEAELFENIDGKLMTIKSLKGDCCFPYVDGGRASKCFSKFSVLDDNGVDTARLRIFDCRFNEIGVILLKDYYAPGFSFNGGEFSEDNKFVSVTYVYDPNIGYNYQKSVLRIFRTNNLEEVGCYKYDGNTGIGTKFFSLYNENKKKRYLILVSLGGQYDAENPFPKPPSLLKILRFKKNLINLVSQVELPQSFDYDFTKKKENSVIIIIGTNLSNTKCDRVIINNKINQSFLEHDGDEYRIYKFKDNKIKLVNKKNYNMSLNIKLYPNICTDDKSSDDQFIVMQQFNGLPNSGYFQIIKVDDKYSPIYCTSGTAHTAPNSYEINFSGNGKWAIVTGSRLDIVTYNQNYLKNVLLYKIIK